ncbi:hypothetical protein G5B37_14700 [Rasiella rasia]|uniref:Uncharacterized protein n=1 Tax=Rasiella rasia TaxID=2744027 RepID=A0A6G6GQD2_9FLAO|nr:hypothetical protein [Rasiella rasia]QIE60759.1 hypothetical protein G5B37_14700 [Rasiella rasia]
MSRALLLIILCVVTFQNIRCQTVLIKDSLEIEFKKTKEISNSYLHSSMKMKKNDHLVRILVRCDLKALFKQPVDINAFSLVDTENKFRYRIATYFGYKKGPSLFSHRDLGRTHLKKEVLNKRGKQYKFLPPHDPNLFDSFKANNFEGYTNIEVPVRYYNLVSGEVISVIYYSPSQKPNFRADMQFVVITNQKTPMLKLYYGKEFITNIELEN